MTETTITETSQSKVFDLEERTFQFAKRTAFFYKKLPKTASNTEYSKQLIRSSSSVGANYIEANESLSKKDFVFRAKICRKESKESAFWLRLVIDTNHEVFQADGLSLRNEAIELKRIFSSMINKSHAAKPQNINKQNPNNN